MHCIQKLGILRYSGNRFERARYYREAWKVLAACAEGQAAEWIDPSGRDHSDPVPACWSFLVPGDLGDELRVIRFVAHAARDVEQVTALVERRLIPLLFAQLPAGDVHRFRSTDLDLNSFSHVAAQERLAYWYGHDDEAIAASFISP